MIKILSPLLSGLEYDDYEMGNMTDVEMMEAEVNINIDNDDDDGDDYDDVEVANEVEVERSYPTPRFTSASSHLLVNEVTNSC